MGFQFIFLILFFYLLYFIYITMDAPIGILFQAFIMNFFLIKVQENSHIMEIR
jgi:hypothetical protein